MKRFTTILLATMLSLAAFAQGGTKDLWHDKSTRGFELTLKGFVAPPGGKIIYDWGGSKHIKFGWGYQVATGYRLNKAISIGIAADAIYSDEMRGSFWLLPTTGYAKFNYWESKRFSPYVSLALTYDFLKRIYSGVAPADPYPPTPDEDSIEKNKLPFLRISPAAGFDFQLSKRWMLSAEVRLDLQPHDIIMPLVGFGATYSFKNKTNNK